MKSNSLKNEAQFLFLTQHSFLSQNKEKEHSSQGLGAENIYLLKWKIIQLRTNAFAVMQLESIHWPLGDYS